MPAIDDTTLTLLRDRNVLTMRRSLKIIGTLLRGVPVADLTDKRDGAEGWSARHIICHLRDFDAILFSRIRAIIEQDNPTYPDEVAARNRYHEQDVWAAFDALAASREAMASYVAALPPYALLRTGTHSVYGEQTALTIVAWVSVHDNDHLEQLTRVLLG